MTRLYDRDFAFAFASQVCFVLANSLLAHYSRWIAFLGGDERDIGWVMGVAPTVGFLLRPYVGQWIDRIGVRSMWVLGELLVLTSAPANLLVSNVGTAIYVLRTLTVLGVAIVFASSLTYVTQLAPPERRTEAIGVFGAAGFLGMIIGPALGDWLLGGPDRNLGAFTNYFTAVAVATAGSMLLVYLIRPVSRANGKTLISLRAFIRVVGMCWPGTILFVTFMFGVCMAVPFGFLAKYVDHEQITSVGVGEFFLVYAGWGIVLRLGLRRLPAQIGRRKVLLAGMSAMGCGMFSFLWVDAAHGWRLLIAALLCGTGHALIFHTMISLAIEWFPPEHRGTGSVLALMHLDLGMIAGGPILGQIAYLGYDWLFVSVGAGCFTAAGIYAWRSIPTWRMRRIRATADA